MNNKLISRKRFPMMALVKTIALRCVLPCIGLAVVMSGCAPTSQILPINPARPTVSDTSRGGGRTIAIEVIDERASKVVGLRDPNTSTSVITAAPEMLTNIRETLVDAYAAEGFTVLPAGSNADVALRVRLTELAYQREGSGALPDLATGATFAVTSTMPNKEVEAVYRDAQTKDTVIKPSLSANAELLNHHVSAALAKLIADPRLTTP